MPQSAPRCRKPRIYVQGLIVMVKKCCVDETSTVGKGWRGEDLAWRMTASVNDLVIDEKANLRFSKRVWIINGMMFLVGKSRRFCLPSLPLVLAISISLQSAITKHFCTRSFFPFVAFCSLHLVKQIDYIQLRWMGTRWTQPMPHNREDMMVVKHTYSVPLFIIPMCSPLSRFSTPGAIDRMTKRST